ncbi:MAG: ABC transporter permease [Capsulimonadaceae bacterium]
MNAVFTLAWLTIKEAIRRRVLVGAFLIALIFVVWSMLPIRVHTGFMVGMDMATARNNTGRIMAWLGCGMIKFFSSVMAVTLAAGAISAEVERGVLAVIVPKPLSRASIYWGKWLGLVSILAVCIAVWSALLILGIWQRTQTFHPHILLGILATCLFPLLFVSLTLCFSSFATYALSAGLALIAAGTALAEDTLSLLARILNAPILDNVGHIAGYIVPLGKMNHWITRGLGDAGLDLSAFGPRGGGAETVATGYADLAYIAVYIVASMAVGLYVFQKRDL